jgi:hypothetical protein
MVHLAEGQVVTLRVNIKQSKISEVSSRYTKAGRFQEGRAGVLSVLTLLGKSASRWRLLTCKVLNFE